MEILRIGTDITECLRIAQMIERHGELFIDRVYTAEEIRYCRSRKQATQHFTARWAAKKAVLKALGGAWVRGIGWRDIEVCHDSAAGLAVTLHGGAKELADRLGIAEILVALSHCRTHAVAYAVATGERK